MYKFFAGWEADGITKLLVDMLRERVRLAEARTATPGRDQLVVGQGSRECVVV